MYVLDFFETFSSLNCKNTNYQIDFYSIWFVCTNVDKILYIF